MESMYMTTGTRLSSPDAWTPSAYGDRPINLASFARRLAGMSADPTEDASKEQSLAVQLQGLLDPALGDEVHIALRVYPGGTGSVTPGIALLVDGEITVTKHHGTPVGLVAAINAGLGKALAADLGILPSELEGGEHGANADEGSDGAVIETESPPVKKEVDPYRCRH